MAEAHAAPLALRDGRTVLVAGAGEADAAEIDALVAAAADPRGEIVASVLERARRGGGMLVARTPDGTAAVACAAWAAGAGTRGDLVCVVAAEYAGVGLGTRLLREACARAQASGMDSMRVELDPTQHGLAALLRDCGMRSSWDLEHPLAHVDLELGTSRPGWATP